MQTVEQASYDAWVKFYRPNENSPNTTISYYTKGGVIGFLLDARVRRVTGGAKTLDDVLKLAYERFSGERGFTSQEFRTTVEDVAETRLDGWFRSTLETVDDLDYGEALDWFGLDLSSPDGAGNGEAADDADESAWLGLVTRTVQGRLVVAGVRRETPGDDAGFNVGDEILAVDRIRVQADEWDRRLRLYRAGEGATVLVARRGRLTDLRVTFGVAPVNAWELSLRAEPTANQTTRLERWIGSAN